MYIIIIQYEICPLEKCSSRHFSQGNYAPSDTLNFSPTYEKCPPFYAFVYIRGVNRISTLLHPACVACHRWKWKAIMDMRLCKKFCTNICAHQTSLKHISPHFYQSWRADFYLLPLTGGHHQKYKRRNLFIQNFAPPTSIW